MAQDTFINITDLQSVTEVADGDYLILETPAGTRIIDFKDFIVPNKNILLSTTVSENTTAIIQNKSLFDTTIASISTTLDEVSSNTLSQSRFNLTFSESVSSSLDQKITSLSNKIFIKKQQVTIPTNNSSRDFVITTNASFGLSSQDISITPANAYAAKNPAYISNIIYNETNYNNTITLNAPFSGNPAVATENAVYNIMVVVY